VRCESTSGTTTCTEPTDHCPLQHRCEPGAADIALPGASPDHKRYDRVKSGSAAPVFFEHAYPVPAEYGGDVSVVVAVADHFLG